MSRCPKVELVACVLSLRRRKNCADVSGRRSFRALEKNLLMFLISLLVRRLPEGVFWMEAVEFFDGFVRRLIFRDQGEVVSQQDGHEHAELISVRQY